MIFGGLASPGMRTRVFGLRIIINVTTPMPAPTTTTMMMPSMDEDSSGGGATVDWGATGEAATAAGVSAGVSVGVVASAGGAADARESGVAAWPASACMSWNSRSKRAKVTSSRSRKTWTRLLISAMPALSWAAAAFLS